MNHGVQLLVDVFSAMSHQPPMKAQRIFDGTWWVLVAAFLDSPYDSLLTRYGRFNQTEWFVHRMEYHILVLNPKT